MSCPSASWTSNARAFRVFFSINDDLWWGIDRQKSIVRQQRKHIFEWYAKMSITTTCSLKYLTQFPDQPPRIKCCAEFVFRQAPMAQCPSDLNLSAFLVWLPSVPLKAQCEVSRPRQPIIQQRHTLAAELWLSSSICHNLWRTDLATDWLDSCGVRAMRHSWRVQVAPAQVCRSGRGTSDIDGNAIRQQWFSCRDPDCTGHGAFPRTSWHQPASADRLRHGVPSPHCDRPPLWEYAQVRVLRLARRAIRQFHKEIAYLAQRPGHLFRSPAGRDLRSAGGGQGSRFALCRRTAGASRTPGKQPKFFDTPPDPERLFLNSKHASQATEQSLPRRWTFSSPTPFQTIMVLHWG